MDPRHKYLETYINQLAEYLGFKHWIFHISEEQTVEEAWCEIQIEEYDEATIKVGTKFWKANGLLKTQALIHELMHCPVDRIHSDVMLGVESLTELVPKKHREVAVSQIGIHLKAAHRREEQFVNMLGVLLAPKAPPWKPPK